MPQKQSSSIDRISNLMDTRCSFCKPIDELILYESKRFRLLLALGPITEGYALIMPKEHFTGFANIPDSHLEEFLNLKTFIRHVYQEVYHLPIVLYEHGRAGVCNVAPGEQLCYHAHLHILPTRVDLLPRLRQDFIAHHLKEYSLLREMHMTYGPYLMYEDQDEELYFIPVQRPIRRQYLRYIAANMLEVPERTDWRSNYNWPEIRASWQKLSSYFVDSKITIK